MANFDNNHPLNVPGSLFTDLTCIDCGTCFHLAPSLFEEGEDEKALVVKQPVSRAEWLAAKRALLSCPTTSIGVIDPPELFNALPFVLPMELEDDVYYLGYNSKKSFGSNSYLIRRKSGNILIDSPRFNPVLVKKIEELGGVEHMMLSHQDDVADHKKFHDYFGCQRWIHEEEMTSDTADCERVLSGSDAYDLDNDFKILFTPGHTRGHLCFLYQKKFLFTGDHLFVNGVLLRASRSYCWFSWEEQVRSMEKLLCETFSWVLPGHGEWGNLGQESARARLKKAIQDMKVLI